MKASKSKPTILLDQKGPFGANRINIIFIRAFFTKNFDQSQTLIKTSKLKRLTAQTQNETLQTRTNHPTRPKRTLRS